jgi:predicted transcriptional regulator
MPKKRYTLYLSRPLARKFDLIAQQRQGAKSALVEEALRLTLEPKAQPGLDDALARRLDELNRNVARIGRDTAIATETLALFVRYFLTITPPLPHSEQEPARLLGRERFEVFVAQVGRRLAGDQRLVSEVLESIANNEPDLFATATDDASLRRRPAARDETRTNGHGAETGEGHE